MLELMLEKLEKIRKAPKEAREKMVALVTIVCVGAITLVWFLLSLPTFFRKDTFHLIPAAPPSEEAPQSPANASL